MFLLQPQRRLHLILNWKIINKEKEGSLVGVTNLFDVGLVFIVGLLFALISVYSIIKIFTPESKLTIIKKKQNWGLELMSKNGKEIQINKLKGEGKRPGTAYSLKNGKVVYVPED